MKQIIIILVLILLIGCSKAPECIDQVINNTFTYYYNTTTIREIEKTCQECEYDKSYVDGLIIEAKKCEKNFTYLDLEDCEDDIDRMEDRWDDCEEEVDELEDELDDCEDELCEYNSTWC